MKLFKQDHHRIAGLGAFMLISALLFLFIDIQGSWSYALPRRFWMLMTIMIVGISSGIATLLFHTITHNRILTPAVMGFESLYILIKTALVFWLGSSFNWFGSTILKFAVESSIMLGFVLMLYRGLFQKTEDLHRLLLIGIIFGVLFASISTLLQRILEPAEFDILQGRLFAKLTLPDPHLILLCLGLMSILIWITWRQRYLFDVIALGRTQALSLGIDHSKTITKILILVSVFVAISTALIGPLTFLGFLAATLAYQLVHNHKHYLLIPMAGLLGSVFLVAGQVVLEHLMGMAGALTIVIEFIGGILFLTLLMKKGRL